MIEEFPCEKAIIGSTSNPQSRWRNHKSCCNNGPSHSTGLSKHFTLGNGYPNDTGREKETLRFTLIDYIDVSKENLIRVGHEKGAKCRCSECNILKKLEDSRILKHFMGMELSIQEMRYRQRQGTIGTTLTVWGQGRMYGEPSHLYVLGG